MKESKLSMKNLLTTIFICALSASNLAQAGEAGAENSGQSRVRFIGNALLGITIHENKICSGGRGMQVFGNTRGLGSALGSLFGKAKNISLGIPATPNVTNLKDGDLILSKAFYREYSVSADEPITIDVAAYQEIYERSYGRLIEKRITCDMNEYFVPEGGNDYEVTLTWGDQTCQLHVMQIISQDNAVQLVPVKLKDANKCSALDTGVPELGPEEQKVEDARVIPEGVKFEKTIAGVNAGIDKHIDELLAKRRAERGLPSGSAAQCEDCPHMIESPDGRQSLDGTHRLPQIKDEKLNRWLRQIESDLGRYVSNQRNYFNLPSSVVAIPCKGADDDLRKAAGFMDLSELPLEQRQVFEREHGSVNHYFLDIRLWPVQASCSNGKLSGEVDLWIFADEVYDSPASLSVIPKLRHVRFAAVDGKPAGAMYIIERKESPNITEYKDPIKINEMKTATPFRAEIVTFIYRQMDQPETSGSVRVINTIFDTMGRREFFEGPQTSIELPLGQGRTQTTDFLGVRKSYFFMKKNGDMHGESVFYSRPLSVAPSAPNPLKGFLAKILPQEAKEENAPGLRTCYKDGVKVDLDPCNVD